MDRFQGTPSDYALIDAMPVPDSYYPSDEDIAAYNQFAADVTADQEAWLARQATK